MSATRASGEPHLGHLVGAWNQWLNLQENGKKLRQYFMIADAQALTDKGATAEGRKEVFHSVRQLACSMLAVGFDPEKSVLVLQSEIPELHELTLILAMLTPWPSIERNPSLREDMKAEDLRRVTLGTLTYPVSQTADIMGVKATKVPVGKDQLPTVYFAQELTRRLNRTCWGIAERGMPIPKPLIGNISRLIGIDGEGKAGKSSGNAIFLADSQETIIQKVKLMPTCPLKIRKTDQVQLNWDRNLNQICLAHAGAEPFIHVPLTYMAAFGSSEETSRLFNDYCEGKIGDIEIKSRLLEVLVGVLEPIQQRLREIDAGMALEIFIESSKQYREVAVVTLDEVKAGLGFGRKAYLE